MCTLMLAHNIKYSDGYKVVENKLSNFVIEASERDRVHEDSFKSYHPSEAEVLTKKELSAVFKGEYLMQRLVSVH